MKKTKIDWADSTWNPVTGCLHGCEYCYARRIAERFDGKFGDNKEIYIHNEPVRDCWYDYQENYLVKGRAEPYPHGFQPTFYRYRLDELKRWKKPRTIFVCSMADLFGEWVPDEWIREVFDACKAAPQHRYLFLTKNPSRYVSLIENGVIDAEKPNIWLGSSTTIPEMEYFWNSKVNTFVSIEPILAPFTGLVDEGEEPDAATNWIIVGAETGNRKNKVAPKKEWVMELLECARLTNTPIFMKESLRTIMGEDFCQEFPWEVDDENTR